MDQRQAEYNQGRHPESPGNLTYAQFRKNHLNTPVKRYRWPARGGLQYEYLD